MLVGTRRFSSASTPGRNDVAGRAVPLRRADFPVDVPNICRTAAAPPRTRFFREANIVMLLAAIAACCVLGPFSPSGPLPSSRLYQTHRGEQADRTTPRHFFLISSRPRFSLQGIDVWKRKTG